MTIVIRLGLAACIMLKVSNTVNGGLKCSTVWLLKDFRYPHSVYMFDLLYAEGTPKTSIASKKETSLDIPPKALAGSSSQASHPHHIWPLTVGTAFPGALMQPIQTHLESYFGLADGYLAILLHNRE